MARQAALLFAVTVFWLLGAVGAAQAAPAPAWSVSTFPYPTNFTPEAEGGEESGPAYHVYAVNVGGATTSGPFTVTDTLPLSVAPVLADGAMASYGPEGTLKQFMNCEVSGQVVTCTSGTVPLAPGEVIDMHVPVRVKAGGPKSFSNTVTLAGGGASPVTATGQSTVSVAQPPFGFITGRSGLLATAINDDGSTATLAGSHPWDLDVGFALSSELDAGGLVQSPGGGVKDFRTTLPPGVVFNPQATERRCTEAELETETRVVDGELVGGCPPESQIGVVTITVGIQTAVHTSLTPLYNMQAPAGSPGVLGFEVVGGVYVHLIGSVRSDGAYELSAASNDILSKVRVLGAQASLWGNPTDKGHDAVRGYCASFQGRDNGLEQCPVKETDTALLTLPSACSGPLVTTAEADSWLNPGAWVPRSALSAGLDGSAAGVQGCSELLFDPSISLKPDSSSTDSASGLAVDLHVPQGQNFDTRAQSTLEGASVTLPTGFAVNPSAANGRTACTAEQIGLKTPVGQAQGIRFFETPAACPDAAKVGSVEIDTPLLDHPLPGSVYLAQPYENPFGSLLAIYLAVFDPQTGVIVKLAGHVEANQATGQLTTTFTENPQLPFQDFRLNFFGGPRAALRTPMTCGDHSAQSVLTPWSGNPPVGLASSMPVTQGANGRPCVNSVQQAPISPSFTAGTVDPLAGAYSPFVLQLSRQDGEQEFGALNVTMPPGMTGKLAGTPYCPDSTLAAAAQRTGREEQASPSCPSASEVGTVTVGAGAGPTPFYATGRAYLAGPYKGAPLSLAIITPAVAGPYDLGVVVVRSALIVDPYTARITVKSDPLPTILKGIPLDVRSIAVRIGKPGFTLNPTNCEPMTLTAESVSTTGQVANLSSRFQVGGCNNLKFKPTLKINLKGATKRSGHPALKAVVTYPKQGAYSNIARAQVGLPHSEFLDQGNLNRVCTQPQLLSATCPPSTVYGKAKAWTPLLDKPLEGPVYLGVGFGYKLPALVADLNGQVRILLKGKVDTTKQEGIRNTFEAVPDAPVSRFVLEMKGGKKYGLLENSENICRKPQKASASFIAQNGLKLHSQPMIGNSCKGKKKQKNGSKKGHKKPHKKSSKTGR